MLLGALPILGAVEEVEGVEEGEAYLVEKRPRFHVPGLEAVGVDALINVPLLAQRPGDLEASGNKTDEYAINVHARIGVTV